MTLPKLRFPEFRDAGDWEEKKLIDITDKKIKWSFIGGPFGSNLKSSDYTTQGIRVIQLQNIGDGEFLDNYKIFTSEQKANELLSCNIYPDEIILSKMGDPVGRACLIPHKHNRYLMCSDGIRLVVDEKLFSKYFIYSLINSDSFRKLLEKTATGSTRKRIGLDDLKNLPMVLPSLPEQQTIADCLSSLDDRLAAETQTIDTLKAHKKGLMQQLFPAEGETLPKLRFPEFRDAGEWEEKRIEDLSIRGSGHTPNKREPSYYNGGIKWVSLADSNKLDNRYIYDTKIKISKEGLENSSAVLHPPGTVIISRDAGVGKSAVLYSAMAVSQHFIVWRCDESKLSNWFLYYFLQVLKPQFEAIATGSTIKTIGLPYFKELCIFTPSIPEQQTIADCLGSIDETIAAQAETIALLKVHKKGLMQQLFPAVEEAKR